jgi:hypothetical protein
MAFGELIPASTISGVTFWGGNNPSAEGGWLLPTKDVWNGVDAPDSMRGWDKLSEKQSQDRFMRTAVEWIIQYPVDWIRLLPKKLARSLTLSFSDQQRSFSHPVLSAIYLLGMIFGLLGGLARIKEFRHYVVLYTLLLFWLVKTLVFYGSARQTILALPAFTVFGALAVIDIGKYFYIAGRFNLQKYS